MGTYINIGNEAFRKSRNSEYVDKSGLIAVVNKTLFTEFNLSCVSRCRRFGKSMAAKMLAAYYDKSVDSRELFADLQIANDPSFEEHLNKYRVIYLDMSEFVTRFHNDDVVRQLDDELKADIIKAYPDMQHEPTYDMMGSLLNITEATGEKFMFIIDEWDAICREFKSDTKAFDDYVNWLRRMFKGISATRVFAGVYMTGILPIKRYNTQSALNNFIEYSMIEPGNMAEFFGFTRNEAMALAEKYGMDFDELVKWYDGYQIGDEPSMFNPNSVMQALQRGRCRSFWATTGAYDLVSSFISMNYEGLKDDIIKMLADGRCKVNTTKFQNDMSIIRSKDDVFTVLIHLGYLGYDWKRDECYIPNYEVSIEMRNAIEANNWKNVIDAVTASEDLLQAVLDGDEGAVASGVEAVHDDNTSILSYNNENSLASVLTLAFYSARNNYVIHREYATGKGFADLVLIPRMNVDSPAIVIELKYNKDADSAIDQIMRKQYPAKVKEYTDNLLLVGINYDKETKTHSCKIENLVN
ncbi:MAG: AAA family ATPase [Prevotella sp.]|nr:AAA family ATPase [Prevotella sp.]